MTTVIDPLLEIVFPLVLLGILILAIGGILLFFTLYPPKYAPFNIKVKYRKLIGAIFIILGSLVCSVYLISNRLNSSVITILYPIELLTVLMGIIFLYHAYEKKNQS